MAARPRIGRRTMTFVDEPQASSEVIVTSRPNMRQQLTRSVSYISSTGNSTDAADSVDAPLTELSEEPEDMLTEPNDDFSILSLDLNLGATRHAQSLITRLERSSISALLDSRLSAALKHLSSLNARVHDPHSRVLVTGDLNAGKSTFVNALLRRAEVMPTDQQPLTTRFVEIASAEENGGKEEVHILDQERYDVHNPSTFSVASIAELEMLATDPDIDASAPPLRVYLKNKDSEVPSILHNGIVDISLIDAPGLNRDSIKTTANFARQEEIDVVVFVVSAANHFTLSAKEFIWQAGQEKAHLFIVVNRFDQIKDKDRCRKAVMDQLRQLSPETYADSDDLVHFVDSASAAFGFGEGAEAADELDETFSQLEQSLRSFVLVNRAKSKLGPAQNYITHLLADVELLGSANTLVATTERDAALEVVERVKPELDQMRQGKDDLEDSLVREEESVTNDAITTAESSLRLALDRVGCGEATEGVEMPLYPGLLGAWDYAFEVRRALLASLDNAVRDAEDASRTLTTDAVKGVNIVGDKHLPADVERSKRVFNANAMFFNHAKGRRSSGMTNVGLSLADNALLKEVSVSDIFDLQFHLFLGDDVPAEKGKTSSLKSLIPASVPAEMSGLGAASVAIGAFSMAGGKTMAIRTIFESAIHLSELASSPVIRKWAGPAFGVLVVGAVAYVVYELPRSIPRNVGRHIRASLLAGGAEDGDETPFHQAEAQRIGREVRKVMRLAAWDLRERFRGALETRTEVVRENEEAARRASSAIEWFAQVDTRVEGIRGQLGLKF